MKEHTLANPTDWPDDLGANFKLLLTGETTCRRLEPYTMLSELQRRIFEIPGKHF